MRILAIISISLSAAVFAANYILPITAQMYSAAACAVIAVLLLLTKRKWLRGAVLAFAGLAVGFGVFLLKYNTVTEPCRALEGEKRIIHGYLLDFPRVYDDYCRAEVMLTDKDLPHVKTIVYDGSLTLASAVPGNVIEANARLKSADMRYGKEYDRYNARDIFLIANAEKVSITAQSAYSLAVPLAKLRNAIGQRISSLFSERESAFLKALMLGDKNDLYKDTQLYTDLSEAGIMHIAAVSGMHIAFLVSVLMFVFGAGRVGALISIAIVWLFVFLTGASPSAVRAGFMQSLLLLAPVVRRENDPVTSLSAVLALVLIKNPYSAADLSLQLSFGAMAGIMLFGNKIHLAFTEEFSKRIKKAAKYPLAIISSSLAVMVFTVPLTAVHFRYVNVLSPLANILTMFAVSFCFCGGFASVALSAIWMPLGKAAAFIVTPVVRYISTVVKAVASLPLCTVYLTDTAMTVWLIAAFIILLIVLNSEFSDRMKLLISTVSVLLLLFSVTFMTTLSYSRDKCSFSVIDVGQGQSIAAMSGDKTVLVDCGGGAKNDNAGQISAAYLLSRGRSRLDALILTHLHSDHTNGVLNLMEKLYVESIVLPKDAPDNENNLSPILESAAQKGTEVRYVDTDCVIEAGNIRAEIFAPGKAGGANERCLTLNIGAFGYDMLITADMPISAENELAENHDLSDTDYLVAGHHGSRYSSGGKLLKAAGADTAIISVGYNTYGHPHNETLARLEAYGYNVFRTDINGSVEIRIR